MNHNIDAPFNMADYFLDDRIREGHGSRIALRTSEENWTYAQVQARANRWASLLTLAISVVPEQRVMIALPDVPDFVACLFGTLKAGAVVVMVNPGLPAEQLSRLMQYVSPSVAIVGSGNLDKFHKAANGVSAPPKIVVQGAPGTESGLAAASPNFNNHPAHPADAAMWLFSGGTTGLPKGVVQSHTSFVNTTELYARRVLNYGPDDITLSVPKLFFGYATGANLLFPFSVGASAVLFPERSTATAIFDQIERHRPTILINVPTMVRHMVSDPTAHDHDLSSLRLATSAGEALPVKLHHRWNELFKTELLDGLGTAEMWHVFLTNRPGNVRPGTLGQVVSGFEIQLCDEDGLPVPDGEVGRMRVRGDSRAIYYWRNPTQSRAAFVGEWYVSGDMMVRDSDGFYTYQGRADDLIKVSGKWLSPREVENCLLEDPRVKEAAVIGIETLDGLLKPVAFVIPSDLTETTALETELQEHVKKSLEPYKYPRAIHFMEDFPRTHLGKVDRGALRLTELELA